MMWQEQRQEAEIPLGFGMSLAQNAAALRSFSHLPEDQRRSVLNGARGIRTRQEMEAYVDRLAQHSLD